MTASAYFEKLLTQYKSTFDLYPEYQIENKVYPAYGYFYSHNEKYVLTRGAKLWETNSFEHVLFITAEQIDQEAVREGIRLLEEYLEPVKVRKGENLPEPNHMYSYLTIVFIAEAGISEAAVKMIRAYRYMKNYRFTIRGYSQGRLIGADIGAGRVWTNRAAGPLKKLYRELMADE